MKQLITAIFISYVLTVSAFAMSEQSPPSQRTQQQNEVYLGMRTAAQQCKGNGMTAPRSSPILCQQQNPR